jgi:hypothetical protein
LIRIEEELRFEGECKNPLKVRVLKSSKPYPEFFQWEKLFVFGDLIGDCWSEI